jgi:protein tyrosine phosphatase (PTP) superfamily phosphohydrolase (DUF442 family)
MTVTILCIQKNEIEEGSNIKQFQVTVVTHCRSLTRRMNINYVVRHERASGPLFQYVVYYVISHNILMWINKV